MAPHSSTLAWKIPWSEEPGRLQAMGSRGVGHDWIDLAAANSSSSVYMSMLLSQFISSLSPHPPPCLPFWGYQVLILCVSCPSPRTNHFFTERWFLLLENGIKNQDLGPEYAHCGQLSLITDFRLSSPSHKWIIILLLCPLSLSFSLSLPTQSWDQQERWASQS